MNITVRKEASLYAPKFWWVTHDGRFLSVAEWEAVGPDEDVRTCGIFLHDSLKCGASPDGLIGDDGTLEIKCPKMSTHVETLHRQTVPAQYYWQIQGQLWLTGRKWCDFVSYDPRLPENASYFCKRVERNDEDISLLETKVKDFLKKVDEEEQFIKTYNNSK